MLIALLRTQLRRYHRGILALVAFQLVSVIASLYLPSLNAAIIDKGLSRGDTDYIWRTGGVMLAVTCGQMVASAGATYLGARTATGFGRDVRSRVFATVGSFSGREINQLGAPSLITRCTNDVQQVQMLVLMGCTIVVMAPIMMVGGIVMALREDIGLSWLMVVAVPVLAIAIGLIVARMVPGFRLIQRRLDGVNRVLREQLMGVRVIRAFVREPDETDRFTRAGADLTDISRRVMRLSGAMFPIVMLVMNASTVAVLWFGGHRVGDGAMQVGALTAYMTYLVQILMSVMMATFMVMMIPRAAVSAERIQEVLTTETSVVPPVDPVRVDRLRGVVDFEQVSMQYPGADVAVLRGVTLHAEPGQTVAIIGSTGSGKTTLISLVARLFDATAGRVLIDGVDVRELDPDLLWGHLGIVPQQPYLFSGTVASNLRYGNPDAADEQLWEALDIAQARGFVEQLDGGLEAAIAQGGTNVSGGQRQRLCIARALVAQPRIYLFDDSFSALDLATDARLREALTPYVREATVFLVAQRVSTITGADQIIVLEDGAVVGAGTHDELIETCATYLEIVESQAGQGAAA